MRTRDIEKVKLRNKGIEVLPSCYVKSGVILSFSLPKPILKKYRLVKEKFETGSEMMNSLLNGFKFRKVGLTKRFYSSEFDEYLASNSIILSNKYKHKDYKFSSILINESDYNRLKEMCNYYRISRSSLFRILIEKEHMGMMK
jgi:hypothetical protein